MCHASAVPRYPRDATTVLDGSTLRQYRVVRRPQSKAFLVQSVRGLQAFRFDSGFTSPRSSRSALKAAASVLDAAWCSAYGILVPGIRGRTTKYQTYACIRQLRTGHTRSHGRLVPGIRRTAQREINYKTLSLAAQSVPESVGLWRERERLGRAAALSGAATPFPEAKRGFGESSDFSGNRQRIRGIVRFFGESSEDSGNRQMRLARSVTCAVDALITRVGVVCMNHLERVLADASPHLPPSFRTYRSICPDTPSSHPCTP